MTSFGYLNPHCKPLFQDKQRLDFDASEKEYFLLSLEIKQRLSFLRLKIKAYLLYKFMNG